MEPREEFIFRLPVIVIAMMVILWLPGETYATSFSDIKPVTEEEMVPDFSQIASLKPLILFGLDDHGKHKSPEHLEVPSYVPIPNAVWLLGTGLIGLIGVRRRIVKKNVADRSTKSTRQILPEQQTLSSELSLFVVPAPGIRVGYKRR